jgi:hypothetical protein
MSINLKQLYLRLVGLAFLLSALGQMFKPTQKWLASPGTWNFAPGWQHEISYWNIFGLIVIVLVEHYFSGVQQVGWGSLMAAVSIFSGSQLLILGVLGEYVGRAYMTVSRKPQSLVRNVAAHRPKRSLLSKDDTQP